MVSTSRSILELILTTKKEGQGDKEVLDSLGTLKGAMEAVVKSGLAIGLALKGGRALIDFSKAAIEAARAAGVAADGIDTLEEAAEGASVAVGTFLIGLLDELVPELEVLGDALKEASDEFNQAASDEQAFEEAMESGRFEMILTRKEVEELGGDWSEFRRILDNTTGDMLIGAEVISRFTDEVKDNAVEANALSQEWARFLQVFDGGRADDIWLPAAKGIEATGEAASFTTAELLKMNRSTQAAIQGWKDAKTAAVDAFFSIDTSVASTAAGYIEQLEFMAAGGGRLIAIMEQIKVAVALGDIDTDTAVDMFTNLVAEAEALNVEMGKLSRWEAAQNIAQQLNIPLQEALDLIDQALATDLISPATVTEATAALDAVQKKKDQLTEAEGLVFEPDPGDVAKGGMTALELQAEGLAGPWPIVFDVTVTGDTIPGSGDEGFQTGAQFRVRGQPGVDNVRVAFNASPGEVVTVSPEGSPTPGGAGTTNQFFFDQFSMGGSGAELAARVLEDIEAG